MRIDDFVKAMHNNIPLCQQLMEGISFEKERGFTENTVAIALQVYVY